MWVPYLPLLYVAGWCPYSFSLFPGTRETRRTYLTVESKDPLVQVGRSPEEPLISKIPKETDTVQT